MKIYVGNLSKQVTDAQLNDLAVPYGTLVSANVATDRTSGESKGFGFVEFSNAPLIHPDSHLSIRDVHEAMAALGPDHIVLSTDAFSRWAPPEPECLRMFVEQLAYLGWPPAQLRQMTADNPRAFLGIAHPPHLRNPLCPGQIRAEFGEHAAAGFDRGQLVRVADKDCFGARCCGGGKQLAQIVGAHHGGLIDDDQRLRTELQFVVAQ